MGMFLSEQATNTLQYILCGTLYFLFSAISFEKQMKSKITEERLKGVFYSEQWNRALYPRLCARCHNTTLLYDGLCTRPLRIDQNSLSMLKTGQTSMISQIILNVVHITHTHYKTRSHIKKKKNHIRVTWLNSSIMRIYCSSELRPYI